MNLNNNFLKGILFALLVVYVISPLDLAPGPVDDLLLILLRAAANTKKEDSTRSLPQDTVEGTWQE
ncbi:MAG: hypothetical protein IJI07_06730 [Flexilinea sp.]|nr:hypothetical protein [Flexilinea sp.]